MQEREKVIRIGVKLIKVIFLFEVQGLVGLSTDLSLRDLCKALRNNINEPQRVSFFDAENVPRYTNSKCCVCAGNCI